jgi:nitroreductase
MTDSPSSAEDPATIPPTSLTRIMRRTRQTRDFRPDPIPDEVLRDILDVARWTGSVSNKQPWTFIVVTDPEVRRRMAEIATNTPHIGSAPVVVVIALEPRGTESDSFDEGRVSERLMIAANAHGVDSGIARARDDAQRIIAEMLGVPSDRLVRSMVSLGYATEAGAAPKSPRGEARKPFDDVVRFERFS